MFYIIFRVIADSATIFLGGCVLAFTIEVLTNFINSPEVNSVLNPPVTPYNYRPEELWEVPTYWKNWEKNA